MLQAITPENFNQMLSRFTTAELEVLIEKYPYFQQAHLLLAKKYQLEKNPRFDQQLQLAALYTQDRELMFRIFNEREVVQRIISEDVTKAAPTEHLQKPVAEPEQETSLIPEIKLTGPEAEVPVVTSTNPLIEEVIETPPVIAADATIEGTIEITPATDAAPIIEEVTEEQADITAPVLTRNLIEPAADVETEDITEQADIEPEADITVPAFALNEPHTFHEWLVAFKTGAEQKVEEAIGEGEEEEELAARQDEELEKTIMAHTPIAFLQELVAEETQYSKGLDQFIDEQIQKHKHPELKKAPPENDIDNEMITETLAKLYEMQKKYTKALKAYQVLSLKFPEKSDLFAARISFLKGLI